MNIWICRYVDIWVCGYMDKGILTEVLRCHAAAHAFPGSSAFCLMQEAFPSPLHHGKGLSITPAVTAGHERLHLGLSPRPVPNSLEGDFTAAW